MKEMHEIKNKIKNSDIRRITSFMKKNQKIMNDYKWLNPFHGGSKWNALLHLMDCHFEGRLISKTDLARQIPLMSRDGSLKWIESLIESEILFAHTISGEKKVDKRKAFLIPNRDLVNDYVEYCKDRLVLTLSNLEDFTIDDQLIK
ncbi:hypothetical protein OAP76_00945 [Alphaproteobacteria bacterium]|nr:hypothetical protein [Alphaproteobacteria bacterium]